jgi:hypothetical protein
MTEGLKETTTCVLLRFLYKNYLEQLCQKEIMENDLVNTEGIPQFGGKWKFTSQ